MAMEFSDEKEFKHHLATSIADDVVGDYESTVKGLMKSRKMLEYVAGACSIMILVISLLSGILGIIDINPIVTKMAAILTLCIGAIERLKVFSDNKFADHTNRLGRLIKKSGLSTFGIYSDRSGQSPDETDHSLQVGPKAHQIIGFDLEGRAAVPVNQIIGFDPEGLRFEPKVHDPRTV